MHTAIIDRHIATERWLNETQLGIGLPSSVLEPLELAVPPAVASLSRRG